VLAGEDMELTEGGLTLESSLLARRRDMEKDSINFTLLHSIHSQPSFSLYFYCTTHHVHLLAFIAFLFSFQEPTSFHSKLLKVLFS